MAECMTPLGEHSTWLQKPTQRDRLVRLSTNEAEIYDWKFEDQSLIPLSLAAEGSVGYAVSPSHCPKTILLRTTSTAHNRNQHVFRDFPTALLDPESWANESPQALQLPKHLLNAIRYPVGITPDGRIVFLDEGLWVCTAQLTQTSSIKRHFFLPHDWVTTSGAQLCQVLPDGTFPCPTKGRVAIIKSSLISEW